MKFPTYEEMAKDVAEKALDEYFYQGKTLREWIQIILESQDEDCISRQAVIDRIRESIETYHNQYTTDMLNMWGLFTQFIKEMPPVNPQPKTGYWIAQNIHNCHTDFKCSECGYIHNFMHLYGEPTADYTYCPICGCRMVEPQERSGEEWQQ